jgi:hypothetical protein
MAQATGVAAPTVPTTAGTTSTGVGITAPQASAAASSGLKLAGRTHFADEPWPAGDPGETTRDEPVDSDRDEA